MANYNNTGRLQPRHFVVLAALLAAPVHAVHRRLGEVGLAYWFAWVALISTLTFAIYGWDKRRARENGQREPESPLHTLELIGGWPGAFLAQYHFRHKCVKPGYQVVFLLIVGLHLAVAVDSLRAWQWLKALAGLLR